MDVNVCTFCNSDIETAEHLFFFCSVTQTFWDTWITYEYDTQNIPNLTYEYIKSGLQMENRKTEFGVNNLILMAKYFIH